MIVIRNSRSSASCHAAAKSAKDVGGSKHQWNIIAISSQLETLRYSLDSIWRWRWQQWWWWEWGWDKDDISEWRCCTCKLSASQGASCLSNMSAMKMSKRNIQFASWLEVVSICHLANLTAPQYDFRFLYMSFLTGHMCIALAKSKSHTLHHLNHFLRAVDSLRRKGSPYSRDRIPAHALDCIPIQHSAAASPFWGPAVHQSTALIPLGQWDIRMFLLVVARERRSTKPIHKRMFEFGLFIWDDVPSDTPSKTWDFLKKGRTLVTMLNI